VEPLPPVPDTVSWVKVSGSFIAKGGEQYLTIGNFQNTDHIHISSHYIYVDDVSLWYCGPDTTDEPEPPHEIYVYPNPAINEITIEFLNIDFEGAELHLYDMLGHEVGHTTLDETEQGMATVDLTGLPAGTYIYRVTTSGWRFKRGKTSSAVSLFTR
jgi:hypothetical protein